MRWIRQSRNGLWLLTVTLVWASGCRTAPVGGDGGFPDEGPLRPASPVTSSDLARPRDVSIVYKVTLGQDAGRDRLLIVQGDDQGWLATLTGWNRLRMSRTALGAVQTHFEEDLVSQVRVEYDPPVTVLPARLAVGQPFEGESSVRVFSLHDGSLRTRGTCRYRVELIGRQMITTPAGRFDAYIVRTRRHMKLSLADAIITWTDAYDPKRGQVAHRLVKKVRLLGFLPTQSMREMRLK